MQIPVRERMVLDEHLLPTGEREPIEIGAGALGRRTFDDEYVAPGDGRPFVLSGGGRRIEVELARGYPFSQVYAPTDDEVIAFEPMTAPTNALVTGADLSVVAPGGRYEAAFEIAVG